MRKALIAAVVASALFAVGAFAANLNVTGDNLASGQDDIVQCGDAEVEWTTDDSAAGDGDWAVTGATVTFSSDDCDGAKVDLAVGTGSASAPTWEDWTCDDVSGTTNSSLCSPDGAAPDVAEVVDVAVLANGNSVPAAAL